MRTARLVAIWVAACAIPFGSGLARANGVFPSAEQIVVDPLDPSHIVVRTTYGLLTTRAAGDPWDWICESAVGYSSGFHPSIGITNDGTVLAGVPDGVSIAQGPGCAWGLAAGLGPGAVVVDLSVEKGDPSHAVAVTASFAGSPARLWESSDNGVTWAQAGVALPAGYTPLTVDVAPSDPERVYVSAQVSTKGALLVSPDRGQTWLTFTVPSTSADEQPFIGAVDPLNADLVYIRTTGVSGHVLVYDHAAVAFTSIFSGVGLLRGFALSPDGQTLLVGGASDGIMRASVADFAFEKVSSVATRCLTWTEAGVYTCASEFPDNFTIGLSHDEGATFETLLKQPCVRGPLDCDPATTAGAACPPEWPAIAIQLGTDECPAATGGAGGGTSGAGGGASGAGGAGSGGAESTTTSGGESTSSGGTTTPDQPGGCACDVATFAQSNQGLLETPLRTSLLVSGGAALAVLFRRGRRRATPARKS